MLVFLTIVAVLIIVALSVYAITLVRQVKKQEREQARAQAEQAEKIAAQQAYIVESLQVISANVIDEDLNLSEATIRCKMLLDALLLSEKQREPYLVLDEVFVKIQHFDTHQARNSLTKEERKKQDAARTGVEQQYKVELIRCFELLRTFQLQ